MGLDFLDFEMALFEVLCLKYIAMKFKISEVNYD